MAVGTWTARPPWVGLNREPRPIVETRSKAANVRTEPMIVEGTSEIEQSASNSSGPRGWGVSQRLVSLTPALSRCWRRSASSNPRQIILTTEAQTE